jgi:hypothetical protein
MRWLYTFRCIPLYELNSNIWNSMGGGRRNEGL